MIGLPFNLGAGMAGLRERFAAFTTRGTAKLQASVRRPGRGSGNHEPTCTVDDAQKFVALGRNRQRRINLLHATTEINKIAGGEPRHRRRAMARALAKRMGHPSKPIEK